MAHVDGESELLVLEVEQLVLGVGRVHEVDTRADVRASHELERERIARRGDTVGARVVRTVERAVGGAGRAVGAEGRVPLVTGVAVGVAGGGVEPAPVGVEDDLGVLGDTSTAGSALLRRQVGVDLSRVGADLLAERHSGEGESDKSD